MGQKVHPEAMRVGYIHDWKSNWFNERHFAEYLHEDIKIRKHIEDKLAHAGLSDITIRKDANDLEVNIHTARPGIVIGKSGAEVDALRRDLHKMTSKQIKVNILEIKRPELDAKLVAQSIAEQLQNRVAFRRAMKRALTSAMRSGAKGVKVQVSGRLGGAEMARTESYSDGRVPLAHDASRHRLRLLRGAHHLWADRREVLGQQGRDHARGLHRRRPHRHERPAPPSGDRDGRGGRDGRDGRGRAVAAAAGRWPVAVGGRAVGRWRWRGRSGWRWTWRSRWRGRGGPGGGRGPGGPVAVAAVQAAAVGGPVVQVGVAAWRLRRSRWDALMLSPKRVKHRKQHRGRRRGLSRGQVKVQFGEYGLKSLEQGWLTNRQIEAARIAMTRKIKRGGKVWINVFPDKPVTKKPAETRMGSGKGNPEGWVAVVKPGRVMFELAGVPEPLAREAIRLGRAQAARQIQVRVARGLRTSDEGQGDEGHARRRTRRADNDSAQGPVR